jgi:hypothetical protein
MEPRAEIAGLRIAVPFRISWRKRIRLRQRCGAAGPFAHAQNASHVREKSRSADDARSAAGAHARGRQDFHIPSHIDSIFGGGISPCETRATPSKEQSGRLQR